MPAATATAAKGAVATAKVDGAKVFASGCNVCHTAGVAGAPKLGDKAAWAPRVGQGIDALTAAVIKGKGAMPPRGAVANASDAELRGAVEYMVATVKWQLQLERVHFNIPAYCCAFLAQRCEPAAQ